MTSQTFSNEPDITHVNDTVAEHDLAVTEDDLLEAKEIAAGYSLDHTREVSITALSAQLYSLLTALTAHEASLGPAPS